MFLQWFDKQCSKIISEFILNIAVNKYAVELSIRLSFAPFVMKIWKFDEKGWRALVSSELRTKMESVLVASTSRRIVNTDSVSSCGM